MTDERIVGLVQRGETRQFTELVRRHQGAIFGMAQRFTGNTSEGQEVAQEVFLRAYRSLEGFKGEAKFSTWLYRICYNLCIDWARKNKGPAARSIPIEGAAEVADPREDPERASIDAEERAKVRKAVAGLDERYRAVVVLLYYQKLSYERIAEILQMPVKTVETRLYRARKILREAMMRDTQ
jgi:RNA polymerase sigma-70 factor (ECF subfamily)